MQLHIFFIQIGAPLPGAFDGLFQPPLLYISMMAGQQDLGHFFAPPFLGPCILRILQQAVVKALGRCRFIIIEHPRDQPGDGIHHHQRRQFPAGQYIIPDGDIICYDFFEHTLIDSFVMPAKKDQFFLFGQFFRLGLVKYAALRRCIDHAWLFALGASDPLEYRLIGIVYRLCLDQHAGTSSVGIVIHPFMFFDRIIPYVKGLQRKDTGFHRLIQHTCMHPFFDQFRE